MITKVRNIAVVLLAVLFLGACSQTYNTKVTRFHELMPPTGETFIIVSKSEDKAGTPQFRTYAGMVGNNLMTQGYTPAASGTPDLIVKIDYAISPPIQRSRTTTGAAGPFYGGFYYSGGIYRRGPGYPYYNPFGYFHPYGPPGVGFGYWGAGGFYTQTYSYAVFERVFEMSIEQNADKMLFEGAVSSIGRDNTLNQVIPALIQAMFTNFPGQNGVTEKIRLKAD